ncbi:MAG: hypothetical protein AUJ89_03340 [Candidatus Omnitrophica bacterium CG1_02_43_210]|nr:MAG: hypothetical protein AUJ89_03340 [Candidatus Omnitrophica bacterium CG1_02_43_210]
MIKKDICLVSPPTRGNVKTVPIALIYLAGWLSKEGIDVDIIDIKINSYKGIDAKNESEIVDKIIRNLDSLKPHVVGLTAFTSEYNNVINLAKSIKDKINTKIVVGGVHASLRPEDFIYDNSPVDIAVIGEGERTLSEVVNNVKNNQALETIDGICFLKEGNAHCTNPRKLIENLGDLSLPLYSKLNMDYYLKVERHIIRYLYTSGVHILTSRGCPFNCTFCAAKNLWKDPACNRRVRFRDINQVVDEIQYLKDTFSIDSFYIADDTFAVNKNRAMQFCDEILSRNLKLIWAMETRVNLVSDELLKMIKKAGCIQVEFGVESGSQDALDRMKKEIKVEDTVRAFDMCKKHRLRTFANIMINTPGETEKDLNDTIKLKKRLKASHAGMNLTIPIIGTDIYEKYVSPKFSRDELGIFSDPHLYTKILDPRFRLAKHGIDLNKMYYRLNVCNYLNSFFEFTFNAKYIKSILNSRRKHQFAGSVLKNLYKQINSYARFIFGFLR